MLLTEMSYHYNSFKGGSQKMDIEAPGLNFSKIFEKIFIGFYFTKLFN